MKYLVWDKVHGDMKTSVQHYSSIHDVLVRSLLLKTTEPFSNKLE